MLCRKFELIPIKIGFLWIFNVAQKSMGCTGSLAKFHQKWLGKNSPFFTFSDAYTCTYVV